MGIGKFELILIIALVILVLFYGAKKLPELARSVGQSAKELKKGFRDDGDDKPKTETKSESSADK